MDQLRVIPIFLPPLHERVGDIELPANELSAETNLTRQREVQRIAPAALRIFVIVCSFVPLNAHLERVMRAIVLPIFPIALLACAKAAPSEDQTRAQMQEMQQLLQPFQQELKGALQQALAKGDVGQAVGICGDKAPEIANRFQSAGIRMGRTSSKLRNQTNNVAPAWVLPILEDLERRNARPSDAVVKALPGNKRGYVEPIRTGPLCMSCHGDNLAPEVARVLDARYPNDHARGYQPEQFRGVFWLEADR